MISKKIWIVALITLLFALMVSCEKTVLTTFTGDGEFTFAESLLHWHNLKKEKGNSYLYKTRFTSFSGYRSSTEIKVEDGIVTSRIFESSLTDDTTGESTPFESYTETGAELGTNQSGADILTLDELYRACATQYLIVDPVENNLYFNTQADGVMTLCGYFPYRCADDCFEGISIDEFEWL